MSVRFMTLNAYQCVGYTANNYKRNLMLYRLDVNSPQSLQSALQIPQKVLLGPGPTNVSPRVLQAMSQSMLGHLHKETIQAMDDIADGLRYAMQTNNDATFCVSATGHGGMECAVANVVQPGDIVIVGVTGLWGMRAADAVRRIGGTAELIYSAVEGAPIPLHAISRALNRIKAKAVFLVHGDTSTGVLQPLEGFGELCHKHNALLLVDAVATVGGVPLYTDRWQLDVVYSASQKALGAPPGLAPITFSNRAVELITARKKRVTSFYWDFLELAPYWGCLGYKNRPRPYHHTVPVSLVLALREALVILVEEGLENAWKRHSSVASELTKRVAALGFSPLVGSPAHRLPTVSTFKPPASRAANWTKEGPAVIAQMMNKNLVEISGGLGPTVGRIIRIGLMGPNAQSSSVNIVVSALSDAISTQSKL